MLGDSLPAEINLEFLFEFIQTSLSLTKPHYQVCMSLERKTAKTSNYLRGSSINKCFILTPGTALTGQWYGNLLFTAHFFKVTPFEAANGANSTSNKSNEPDQLVQMKNLTRCEIQKEI